MLGGCYSLAEPSFDPGNQRDVLRSIVRRGIVISEPIVGETACDDPALIGNSTYLTARMPDEDEARDVYIQSYREKSWEQSIEEVDRCMAQYAAANPGSEIRRLDIPTFRVFGADWSDRSDPGAHQGLRRSVARGQDQVMPPEPAVSSRQNPRFKAALALRDARERRARGHVLVDGAREIGRALDAGVRLIEAWVCAERIRRETARALLPRLATAGEIVETTPELLARLAYGERDEGIVAVLEMPSTDLQRLQLPEQPLIAVVEGVEKPGNLGALLRSADGAGVDAVIVVDAVSDIWNPNAVRASVGTIFSLPLAACSSAEALAFLRGQGVTILTARVGAELDYDAADLTAAVALVVGAETVGLSQTWTGEGVMAISIPMLGLADSLNVSASAAVLFYEARRQRRAAQV